MTDHIRKARALFERAEALFNRALELPRGERQAFLIAACGEDVELLREVEAVLEHDEQAGEEFLKPADLPHVTDWPMPAPRPPGASTPLRSQPSNTAAPSDPRIGQKVGHYSVKAVIARGGMGTVYEAEQDQPRRTVALKVMNRGLSAPSALRRFQFEVETLGRLLHPNIARVYEAGMDESETGPEAPWFAMEYIPSAKTLTQYAAEQQLDLRARVELFAKVCDAVQHGHQKGVIHRDLKPANILVDSAGEPKVIDFGVARATDSDLAQTTAQTCLGQLVGTVQYMSPEQCDGDPHDIDLRSDVYSLGVVLYELLTAEMPYQATGTTLYAATRAIKEVAPRLPSLVKRALRGDLEAVILRALEKQREKRYQSATDLARDLRHWLNREPTEARGPTAWMRVMRGVARHPAMTTAALCAGIAVLTFVSTYIAVWLLNNRPWAIVDDEPCFHVVRVESASGRPLKTWGGGRGAGIASLGVKVDLPESLGGGAGVVVGFGGDVEARHPRSLCLFSFDNLEEPKWERHVETNELPAQWRQQGLIGEHFSVECGTVADVFPTIPARDPTAPEIVAVFTCHFSNRIIRIYDLEGHLHYQVCHDGAVSSVYWMSGPRLLACAGDNAEDDDKPLPAGQQQYWRPRVVFAIRPQIGVITYDWLGSEPADRPDRPVWYKQVHPRSLPRYYAVHVRKPLRPHDPDRTVECQVYFDEQAASVSWVVDERGDPIRGTRFLNSFYRPHEADLPDPAEFGLGPLRGGTDADISRP